MKGLQINQATVDEAHEFAYPEWLAETADMEWEELTDEQKKWFENYRGLLNEEKPENRVAKLANTHALGRPKMQGGMLQAAMADAETKQQALTKMKETVVHFMSYDSQGSKGPGVYCSCGMFKLHKRGKVLAAWADKHYEKYGHFWKRT